MDAHKIETRVSPWVSTAGRPAWDDSDIAAYRVWKQFDGQRWYQQHEWKCRDGSTYLDKWMFSSFGFESHLIADPRQELDAA